MFGKKKTYGLKEAKPKTRDEISKKYAEIACDVGHKTRLMRQHKIRFEQFEQEVTALQKEIDQLTQKLIDLNVAGMALPQETKPEETKETA